MKNKAVMILKLMTTLVIVLIGVLIWIFLNQEKNPKQELPREPEIKEENLDINSELVKNLFYPDMQDRCSNIETIGRYSEKNLKAEDISLSEKIDTAYRKLSDQNEETISSVKMRQYVETYWGTVEDYEDFTFSTDNTNYTYDENEQSYHIEILNVEETCEEKIYSKQFVPVLMNATKKENQIILDYVLVYYIEDASAGTEIIYHLYQDQEFTIPIKTVSENEFNLNSIASKYKAKLEHYSYIFKEQNNKFYFLEGKKSEEIKSLEELELTEATLENLNLLSLEDFCFEFDENSVYQKPNFSLEDLDVKTRLLLAFHYSVKNKLFSKEGTKLSNVTEYIFTEAEVKDIYKTLWGEELNSELEDFEQFGYQGFIKDNQYHLLIQEKEFVCPVERKYVEKKIEKVYQKDDVIYIDYKIRFLDYKTNTISIYSNKNYEKAIKENIRKRNIYEEYWDLEYVTYRYVFKKQEDGKFYFLEGLYI